MALYVKDLVKLWVTTDSNYKQPVFERSDDTLNTRERTDISVVRSGYSVLESNADTVAISTNDMATVLAVYVESSDKVKLNITKSSAGIVDAVVGPVTNTKAKFFCDVNVNTSSSTTTIQNISGNANVVVSWAILGV